MNPVLGLIALGIISAMALITRSKRGLRLTAAEAQSTALVINYAGNPFRTGAYVYVQEEGQPGPQDWQGTYLGMQDGYALIRDTTSGITVNVNKDQCYAVRR